jgi:hypothetical protein
MRRLRRRLTWERLGALLSFLTALLGFIKELS